MSTVESLLRYGAALEQLNKEGLTALSTACAYNCPEVAKVLVTAGADVHIKSPQQANLLHLVLDDPSRGNPMELLAVVVAAGVDVNEIDIWGSSPLPLI